jgi:uncharacterized protein YjbI with pentapeptide repeats
MNNKWMFFCLTLWVVTVIFDWLCLNKIYALTGKTLLIAAILVSLVVFYKQIPRWVNLFSSIFLLSFVISLAVEFWPSIWQWSTMYHEILRNIALSTIAILGGPFVVWRTYLFQKDIALKAQNTNIADRNSFNDIFTKAIEQLGALKGENEPNIEVRIGAIYALEKLSEANTHYQQIIIDILCNYVRANSPNLTKNGKGNPPVKGDVGCAMAVIGRRKQLKEETSLVLGAKNLSSIYLENSDFSWAVFNHSDLNHSFLEGADLRNCDFKEADLTNAFLGESDLRGAINLTCEQLTTAENWQQAYRDPELACGASIPIPPDEEDK